MSTYSSLSTSALISQMERAGRVPEVPLMMALFERRAEAEALVLALFRESYDDHWPDDDPRWYRFIHAGRLLIAWGTEAALPTFADMYLDDALQDTVEWFENDPLYFGPPAVPYFLRVLMTADAPGWHYGRSSAASILSQIARRHPETRDTIAAAMRALLPAAAVISQLPPAAFDEMWLWIVNSLAEMQDEASRPQALALLAHDGNDSMVLDRDTYEAIMRGELINDDPPVYDLAGKYARLAAMEEEERRAAKKRETQAAQPTPRPAKPSTPAAKIGRNDPCPCGSGKKYKHCHGRPGQ